MARFVGEFADLIEESAVWANGLKWKEAAQNIKTGEQTWVVKTGRANLQVVQDQEEQQQQQGVAIKRSWAPLEQQPYAWTQLARQKHTGAVIPYDEDKAKAGIEVEYVVVHKPEPVRDLRAEQALRQMPQIFSGTSPVGSGRW